MGLFFPLSDGVANKTKQSKEDGVLPVGVLHSRTYTHFVFPNCNDILDELDDQAPVT